MLLFTQERKVGDHGVTHLKEPDQHFNAYYQDNSLLIQFILEEFIATQQLTHELLAHLDSSLNESLSMEVLRDLIKHYLYLLIGTSEKEQGLMVSRWTQGPLLRFKYYCEQFSQNTNYQNKDGLSLQHAIYEVWLQGIHILEFTRALHSPLNSSQKQLPVKIKRILSKLRISWKKVVRMIPKLLKIYRTNENVLFFIMRKKESLTTIYGSSFFRQLFKASPKKKDPVSHLIQSKYRMRGFEHLLSSIHQFSTEGSS